MGTLTSVPLWLPQNTGEPLFLRVFRPLVPLAGPGAAHSGHHDRGGSPGVGGMQMGRVGR